MKYTKCAVAALCSNSLVKSHELARMMESSNIVPHSRSSTVPKHLRLERKTDVGILSPGPHFAPWKQMKSSPCKHPGRNLALSECPNTCKDEGLCNCVRAYYNSDEEESCITKISSACKANELLPCYPVTHNESDPKYVGHSKANAYYNKCPLFECFDAAGLSGNPLENTTAYYSCICKARSNMCEKCEEMKDEVPYCQTWLSRYGDFCPDFINCCDTETSYEGLTKCMNLAKAFVIENDQGLQQEAANASSSNTSVSIYPCPNTCKDEVLCNCIRLYYNSDKEESCTAKISSACKSNEFLPCYPARKNESDPKYAGYSKAYAYYYQCPMFECFEASGLAGALNKNMTAYYLCTCKARSNMCEKCEEMKYEVPYCQTWLATYGGSCTDFMKCCETETSQEGLSKCSNLIMAFLIENEQALQQGVANTSSIATESSISDIATSIEHDQGSQQEVGSPSSFTTDESSSSDNSGWARVGFSGSETAVISAMAWAYWGFK
ncbi:hypothetical protein ACHAXN_009616 [Cyclotella atomus]